MQTCSHKHSACHSISYLQIIRPAFRLLDTSEEQQLCTYARINTLELELSAELSEYWQEPSSYFLASGRSDLFSGCHALYLRRLNLTLKSLALHSALASAAILLHAASGLDVTVMRSAVLFHSCMLWVRSCGKDWTAGTMLKEAIEDLEWGAASGAQSQAAVRLHLRRSPPQIALTASEIADMTIKLPVRPHCSSATLV